MFAEVSASKGFKAWMKDEFENGFFLVAAWQPSRGVCTVTVSRLINTYYLFPTLLVTGYNQLPAFTLATWEFIDIPPWDTVDDRILCWYDNILARYR